MTATTRRSAGAPDTPRATAPCADCTADSAGGLSFDVTVSDAAERWDAALLLRLRGSEPEESVRLPLVPLSDGSDGSGGSVLRATLPSTVPLAEGRWDVYLALGEGEPQRLLPGCNDLRSLVDRVPRTDRTWLGVRIPYATKYGNLSVRSWLRWPHAEAGEVWPADGGLTVHGRLYGADLAPDARLEARPRGRTEPDAPVVLGTLEPQEERSGGHGFTARLEYGDLCRAAGEGTDDWGVWLRPGGEADPVRVARVLDDIVDKAKVLRYPALAVAGDGARPGEEAAEDGADTTNAVDTTNAADGNGTVWVRPYYTGANDLSLRLERSPSTSG
ncbi:hypothetical protein F0L17_04445 [Streptomyces sp. TRM43335]|uniref:Transferase n=1 Tax=Streptomyces taklimakanensis TaxID=2569853 RepID=A0A6G2B807_9ACTN|nr:hypothetical protein [Streptomyces taklimakanensis]MTE18390.1 hypothetical protein [Streptomyces taklimakanensis]